MKHPLYFALPWAVGTIFYVSLALYYIGIRHDVMLKITEPFFTFELLLSLAVSISAAMSSSWLRIPDMRGMSWINTVTITLLGVFILMCVVRTAIDMSLDPHLGYDHQCHKLSIVFGILPAIAIWIVSMRGKTTRPILMAFMNTLSIGGMGYVGLRLVCSVDDMGHLCIFHMLPYLALGFVAAIVSRRFYHW